MRIKRRPVSRYDQTGWHAATTSRVVAAHRSASFDVPMSIRPIIRRLFITIKLAPQAVISPFYSSRIARREARPPRGATNLLYNAAYPHSNTQETRYWTNQLPPSRAVMRHVGDCVAFFADHDQSPTPSVIHWLELINVPKASDTPTTTIAAGRGGGSLALTPELRADHAPQRCAPPESPCVRRPSPGRRLNRHPPQLRMICN